MSPAVIGEGGIAGGSKFEVANVDGEQACASGGKIIIRVAVEAQIDIRQIAHRAIACHRHAASHE